LGLLLFEGFDDRKVAARRLLRPFLPAAGSLIVGWSSVELGSVLAAMPRRADPMRGSGHT
jgi:hypothetical protein